MPTNTQQKIDKPTRQKIKELVENLAYGQRKVEWVPMLPLKLYIELFGSLGMATRHLKFNEDGTFFINFTLTANKPSPTITLSGYIVSGDWHLTT